MPQDYLHDDDDDLLIVNGDFAVGESTVQHQSLLLRMQKGELRQYPKTCIGIDDFLLAEDAEDMRQEIQKQYEADGMKVRSVKFTQVENGLKPIIDAFYP